jgi:hypothetical protein
LNLIEFTLKDLDGKMIKKHSIKCSANEINSGLQMNPYLYFDSLDLKKGYFKIEIKSTEAKDESIVWDTILLPNKEKEYALKKPTITITKIDEHHLKLLCK